MKTTASNTEPLPPSNATIHPASTETTNTTAAHTIPLVPIEATNDSATTEAIKNDEHHTKVLVAPDVHSQAANTETTNSISYNRESVTPNETGNVLATTESINCNDSHTKLLVAADASSELADTATMKTTAFNTESFVPTNTSTNPINTETTNSAASDTKPLVPVEATNDSATTEPTNSNDSHTKSFVATDALSESFNAKTANSTVLNTAQFVPTEATNDWGITEPLNSTDSETKPLVARESDEARITSKMAKSTGSVMKGLVSIDCTDSPTSIEIISNSDSNTKPSVATDDSNESVDSETTNTIASSTDIMVACDATGDAASTETPNITDPAKEWLIPSDSGEDLAGSDRMKNIDSGDDLLVALIGSNDAMITESTNTTHSITKLLGASDAWNDSASSAVVASTSTAIAIDNQITTNCTSNVFHPVGCLDELKRSKEIFEIFAAEVKRISTEWKHVPISQLIALFPELQYIDNDFLTIKSLFDDSAIASLRQILTYWKDHQRINEICQSIINLLKYLNLTNDNDNSPIIERMLKLNEETSGEICCETYNEYYTSYPKKYSDKTLNFMEKFNASTELLEFIRPLTSTDIESLLESVNDSDETLIDASAIINLTKIKSFFEHINQEVEAKRKQSGTSVPHDIIMKYLENLLNEKDFEYIDSYIDSSLNSLTSIQRMYMELTNKGLSKRQRIFEIMQRSQLAFSEQRKNPYENIEHQFDVKITIKEQTPSLSIVNCKSVVARENVKERPITYIDLHELRDRARLIEYSTNKVKEDSEDQLDKLRLFIRMVDLIENILKDLTSLNLTGHPSVSEYLESKRIFRCDAGNFAELETMSNELNKILTDWNNELCDIYKGYVCVTYFSHQQLWSVEDYLYDDTRESKNDFAYHFMKFLDINIGSVEATCLPEKTDKPEERLRNIARILNGPQTTTTQYPEKSAVIKTIFIVGTTDEGILRAILSIFRMNKMQPQMKHLFYCTPTTTWIEIRAFVYRCFYSKQSLHQLIRPELLSLSIQDQFTRLIRDLINNDSKHSLLLSIVTTAPTEQLQLVNGLRVLKIDQTIADHELLDEEKLENEIKKLIGKNCEMVTSNTVGLGKSTYIRDKIEGIKKEYIKLTIYGKFDIDTIIEKLIQITPKLLSSQAAIHLDIGIIDNVQQLNDFLYCLLIFRASRSRHSVITIPVDLPIFVEFDSSPSSIRIISKLFVLRYLPKHNIDRIDWNQLKIENRWSTLFVVKYLKAIHDQTIIRQTITRDINQLRTLTVEECIKHLKDHFLKGKNDDFVTWTQLNIYTSVYDTIFTGFSLCGHFMVFDDERRAQSQLRIHILQALLNSSNQFTSLSVENVRNKQRSVDTTDTSLRCGKTSLIQTLCRYILEDDIEIFRIHAGITNENIIAKMNDFKEQAKQLKERTEKCEQHNLKQRLWIFFDEFNTTSSIGLFKEIICERTLLGEPLPDNMVFLGACNPQRQKAKKFTFDSNIGIKKDRYTVERSIHVTGNSSLLYNVVSVPETMLEYVWDFGFLDEDTERKYIDTMLNICRELKSNPDWCQITLQLIVRSQVFFRESEDVSSVSLRDVARFCRLYNWYFDCIRKVNNEENIKTSALDTVERASLIALALCYYFRISSPEQRRNYVEGIETVLKSFPGTRQNMSKLFTEVLRKEKDALVNRMELPKGTAKNRGLIENIFVLVACIVNRIPVILCGKPGCGKTLSVQIVMANLKGKKSKDRYFQQLPPLIPVSYQGSQNCTSESVFKVFERANKYIEDKQTSEFLPVIIFDEIGLAELSPHNPLKVLHSELEVDSCRHGFVGLSNWRLDASKMNRALYLACPDPDKDDLLSTAHAILEAEISKHEQITRPEKKIIHSLVAAYNSLYELTNRDRKCENYFGLRDYYAMMKSVVHDLVLSQQGQDLFECIRKHLKANFDGTWDASEYMWENFCEHFGQDSLIGRYKSVSKFDQILNHCLSTRTGRYLMLIGKNESVIDYAEQHIRSIYAKYPHRSLIGSSLSGDLFDGHTYSERYNYKVLMDVILHVETKVTLIMRRMGHLYDNLYDLFNQNFAVSAQKKFCRIALGDLYHPRCLVNDEFYCIVFVQESDLPKCDLPFLNRFEKHVIDMKSLVHEYHWSVQLKVIDWLKNLLPEDCNEHFPLFQHLFVDYSDNYIYTIVHEAFRYLKIPLDEELNEMNTNAALAYCQDKLIQTSSLDFPLILSLKENNKNNDINCLIEKYYEKHKFLLLSSLLESTLGQTQIPNRIIYTYTQIYDDINYGNYTSEIDEIKFGNFKTELEFTKRIKSHYKSTEEKQHLLLIRVDYHEDHKHILLIKHILLNEHITSSNRGVWIILHLQRNMLNQTTNDVLFNGWSPVMIDDLNKSKLISRNVFINSSYINLIDNGEYHLSDCLFNDTISRCLGKFNYQVAHKKFQTRINVHRQELIELLMNTKSTVNQSEKLRSIIHNQLSILIGKVESSQHLLRLYDWRRDLLTKPIIIGKCRSVLDGIEMIVSSFYDICFTLLFTHLEKYSFIDTFQFISTIDNETIRKELDSIWRQCLTFVLEKIDLTVIQRNPENILFSFDLHLPCAKSEYKTIRKIREVIAQDIRTNDNDDFDDEKIFTKAMNLWRTTSFYKFLENFPLIENNNDIFKHYYHDQVTLSLEEAKIYQLSSEFVVSLLTTNLYRSNANKLQHLLIDNEELFELLRIFEIGTELIEEKILTKTFKTPIPLKDSISETQKKNEAFYTLGLTKEKKCYLIPPNEKLIKNDDYEFECAGDPWIETCLMNLIELLVSKSVIEENENIERLSTIYGLIEQGVIGLNHYACKNLEKLRSFNSLLRCIKTLLPNDSSMEIFKRAYQQERFVGTFKECNNIDEFIQHLRQMIKEAKSTLSADIIEQTIIKLEIEFLKNWLIDHSEKYEDVLRLIDNENNNLWLYSTKIFLYLDKKFDIVQSIKRNNGNSTLIDSFEKLNKSITHMSTKKIHHLMVNYIHMHLMVDRDNNSETIETKLQFQFEAFSENVKQVQDNIERTDSAHDLNIICLIAWIKYYCELYACALNNRCEDKILKTIDEYLSREESSFAQTTKLFVIKQLCQLSNTKLNELYDVYRQRHVVWIHSMLSDDMNCQSQQRSHNIILPTPLFKYCDEYKQISDILDNNPTLDKLKKLIEICSTKQDSSYCFLLWFINYYSRYSMADSKTSDQIKDNIVKNLEQKLTASFESIGYKFLVGLLNNFDTKSYFHLNATMKPIEVQQRLLVLNIFALILSFKARGSSTYLSSLLFNQNLKTPNNYDEYFRTSICIPGLRSDIPVITQMIDVRTQVDMRLKKGTIWEEGKFIFKCSENCNWMYYFENCGQPNSESKCPLCNAIIGGLRHELRIRDPPQIKMSIHEANEFITSFIEKHNQNIAFGYHTVIVAEESQLGEKSDHLDLPLSFRFLHMLSHSIFLVLHELDLLNNTNLPDQIFFRTHFEKDYELISQQLDDSTYGFTWLFKLMDHMIDAKFISNGQLNNREKLIEFETNFEKELIFNHIGSISNDIKSYLKRYTEFVSEQINESALRNFVDEIAEKENRFPLLTYFNTTDIYTINPINKLRTKLKNVPYVNKLYPITTFIIENLEKYANIRYLYPIVSFTNYLIEKFDHRIKRNEAASATIENCFNKNESNMISNIYSEDDQERETIIKLYEEFVDAWYKLTLKKVQYGCHHEDLNLNDVQKEEFAKNTKLAMVLLNVSKDNSSILVAACLRTIGELQNEIVNYCNSLFGSDPRQNQLDRGIVPLQGIRPEHALRLNSHDLSSKLMLDCFTINYQYGMSKDFVFDYEEIEMTLRKIVSCLPLIETEKMNFINYQFELYGENALLITDIRNRVKQEPLQFDDRKKLKARILSMKNDQILNYLGSLDYVFTYLRHMDSDTITNAITIQQFAEECIKSHNCLHENILRQQPFSTIYIKYIIDLYELLEEITFDKIVGHYIPNEYREKSFSDVDRIKVINEFIKSTYTKETITPKLKECERWISLLKRIILRILLNINVSTDVPLQLYLERADLWTGDITEDDIDSFSISHEIQLRHTFIILNGLKAEQTKLTNDLNEDQDEKIIQNIDTQTKQATTWNDVTETSVGSIRTIRDDKKSKKQKIRV
ncbi:unnamed protein product [Rotaria sp. Silwood1]|nr:unnamed protein product [Rotaria sp. Silwood1]